MNKLGSEFINDFEKREFEVFGVNVRTVVLLSSIISLVVMIAVISYFNFSEIIYEIYSIGIVTPAVLYGIRVDKLLQLKGRTHYFFLEKRRVYRNNTEFEEKGDESD